MGVFDDKKFEELDWISQAVEPMDSQLNEILSMLPDELLIDYDAYVKFLDLGLDMELSVGRLMSYLLTKLRTHYTIGWKQQNALIECFKLVSSQDTIEINFEDETMNGEIKLIKITSTMDEKMLESMLGLEGIEKVSYMTLSDKGAMTRLNDVLELLGKSDEALRSRSPHKKRKGLSGRLKSLFKENEWKIKDMELANKIGYWISEYVSNGDLCAYANFCKLKVMTHKDQPIYSMEEVK